MSIDNTLLILAILSTGVTYWATKVFIKIAVNRQLVDIPNHRSSHTVTTPSAGGLVFTCVCTMMLAAAFAANVISTHTLLAYYLGSLPLALVSFVDDQRTIGKRWRFATQIICVAAALYFLPTPNWHLPTFLTLPGYEFLIYLMTGIGILWLINLYNFMDGIDGLAITEAITVLFCAGFLLWYQHQPYILPIIIALPLLGFAILNWAPAKIFMGDTGSTYLGFILAGTALALQHYLNLWVWVILLGTFIVDATYTLATRMVTGQPWREAHRSHSYQKLACHLNSHSKVVLGNIMITLFWLLPCALWVLTHPTLGVIATICAYLPLLITPVACRAGKP